MRPRRYWYGETRRLTMMLWCKIKMGSDSWLSFAEIIGILILWFMLSDASKGDVLVYSDFVDMVVVSETPSEAVEIGWDLGGKGRPLGYLSFMQPEPAAPFGPYVEFGSWSAMTADSGVQRLAFFLGDDGYIQTANYGDRLVRREGMMQDYGAIAKDSLIPNTANEMLYIPFLWDSYADQFGSSEIDTYYGGTGWISLSAINQYPAEGENPYFIVDTVTISTGDLFAGQTSFQTVPEPSTWAVCAALIFACWKMRGNYNARAQSK